MNIVIEDDNGNRIKSIEINEKLIVDKALKTRHPAGPGYAIHVLISESMNVIHEEVSGIIIEYAIGSETDKLGG